MSAPVPFTVPQIATLVSAGYGLLMRGILRSTLVVIGKTAVEWIEHDIPRLGAALSFDALFSIQPLVVIVLAISGFWSGEAAARRELFGQVSGAVGQQGSDALQSLVRVAHEENRNPWSAMIALNNASDDSNRCVRGASEFLEYDLFALLYRPKRNK